jgi:Cathepsin propeptide inhibitor domain (I29)
MKRSTTRSSSLTDALVFVKLGVVIVVIFVVPTTVDVYGPSTRTTTSTCKFAFGFSMHMVTGSSSSSSSRSKSTSLSSPTSSTKRIITYQKLEDNDQELDMKLEEQLEGFLSYITAIDDDDDDDENEASSSMTASATARARPTTGATTLSSARPVVAASSSNQPFFFEEGLEEQVQKEDRLLPTIDKDFKQQQQRQYIIEESYRRWCDYYKKDKGWSILERQRRLQIFASHYEIVEDYHKQNPTKPLLVLNEYADLTRDEYSSIIMLKTKKKTNKRRNNKEQSQQNQIDVDRKIRRAYKDWCYYYNKSFSENGLQAFAHNYNLVQEYCYQTNQPLIMNEYADLTETQYRHRNRTRNRRKQKLNLVQEETSTTVFENTLSGDYNPSTGLSSSRLFNPTLSLSSSSSPLTLPPSVSTLQEMVSLLESWIPSSSVDATSIQSNRQQQRSSSHDNDDAIIMKKKMKELELVLDDVGLFSGLERSVVDIADVNCQTSTMIDVLSCNQIRMVEMITSLQEDVSQLKTELRESRNENRMLKDRLKTATAKSPSQSSLSSAITSTVPLDEADGKGQKKTTGASSDFALSERLSSNTTPSQEEKSTSGGTFSATNTYDTGIPTKDFSGFLSLNPIDVMFKPHATGFDKNLFLNTTVDDGQSG